MSTVEMVNPKKVTAKKILKDLTGPELRDLAKGEETTSSYGSPIYFTTVKNRSAKNTFVVENGVNLGAHQKGMDPEKARGLVRKLQESIASRVMIQVDRRMGMASEATLHCRLFVPAEFARIAYMWHNMLFPIASSGEPDFVSVYVPDWPERIIFLDPNEGYTYICGTDYPGEAKKSMLRQAMYWMKKRGGLGLHAGSKILRVAGPDGKSRDVGFLLFGLSGTGKTTLTLHDHGLAAPERVIIKQDDVVLLAPDAQAFGTEDGFYIKTEGLEPTQRVLWDAAISPTACFENVKIHENGDIDFVDTTLTSNGRGVVLRKFIHGTDDGIDLPKAHKIIFITRRNDVVPVVAKLTPQQGAAFFMLGESIETSAGDPTKAGQAKREVGTNPLSSGPRPRRETAFEVPLREPRHGGLHSEHRLRRGGGRERRREDLDPRFDRDHEANREGWNFLAAGPRLGLFRAAAGPGRGPFEIRPPNVLLAGGIRRPRRAASIRAGGLARPVSRARPFDSEGDPAGELNTAVERAIESEHRFHEGLEDVVAAESAICYIDGERGVLSYRGYDIHDLAENSSFEETCFLLWEGRLPTKAEVAALREGLGREREVSPEILSLVQDFLKHRMIPMDALRTAVSALCETDPDVASNDPAANRRKALRLTAKMSTLVAAIHRFRSNEAPVEPDPGRGHAEDFLAMLNGRGPSAEMTRAFDMALVLHADHELNASTFAARVTAATLSDMHSAVVSAIGTLKGPAARRRQRGGHPDAHGDRRPVARGRLHPRDARGAQENHGVRPPGLHDRGSPGDAPAPHVPGPRRVLRGSASGTTCPAASRRSSTRKSA